MIWNVLFIFGIMVLYTVAAIVGASVWVLWEDLFPQRAHARDWMSRELEELLEVESRKP